MDFYLGTHMPSWMPIVAVPLFISRRRLHRYKKIPQAQSEWCLDSGGFSELSMYGEWRTTPEEYIDDVNRFAAAGQMKWCAPQDWMCEPWITAKTGLTVETHLQKTVENYLLLKERNLPVIPVLQGWQMPDYERCAEIYSLNNVDLASASVVGLGSVCRRQATSEIGEIAKWGFDNGWKLHGFGVKAAGLAKYGNYLKSADSLAWSFSGRYIHNNTCGKPSCANCMHYALEWREKVIGTLTR
jgi:hypothetical protein